MLKVFIFSLICFSGVAHAGKKLYVGNLAYSSTERDLENLFGQHGSVQSVQIIIDRDTGRSKGFGFIEMGTEEEAQAAIAGLHGKEVDGRVLTVNEARPREEGIPHARPSQRDRRH